MKKFVAIILAIVAIFAIGALYHGPISDAIAQKQAKDRIAAQQMEAREYILHRANPDDAAYDPAILATACLRMDLALNNPDKYDLISGPARSFGDPQAIGLIRVKPDTSAQQQILVDEQDISSLDECVEAAKLHFIEDATYARECYEKYADILNRANVILIEIRLQPA